MTRSLFGRITPPTIGPLVLALSNIINLPSRSRIWFRPRVLRDVTTVDFSTTILGNPSSMPVYIVSPATLPLESCNTGHILRQLLR